jgi:hypothetical protein
MMARPRTRLNSTPIGLNRVTPAEQVVLLRWFCTDCKTSGTCATVPHDSGDDINLKLQSSHSRKSPACRWNEELVKVSRLKADSCGGM